MKKTLNIVYIIFLGVFVVLPLLVIFYFAFTDATGAFSLGNALYFFSNKRMLGTLLYSLFIGVSTTVVCLVLAYPVAYFLAKGSYRKNKVFLMAFVIPMWINFTLRITALKEILTLIEGNMAMYQEFNSIVGMVYDFLPFMILPIYNSIADMEDRYIQAASDLGARPYQVFTRVVIPLSVPGIISGITMVLLPSMTNYVVLDMVYNSTYIMGSLIGSYFSSYDWNNGALISLVLLLLIVIFTALLSRIEKKREGLKR